MPILFFSIQLLIGIIPLFIKKSNNKTYEPDAWDIYFRIILVGAGIVYTYNILSDLYTKIGIHPGYSDIIPLIQKMSKNFLAGQYPYTPFDDFGYVLQPTYLPAQWMPYVIAEKFRIDPRFISFWIFIIAYIVYAVKITRDKINLWQTMPLLALPILLVYQVTEYDHSIWSVTVEQLIMSYYLLFGLSLTKNNRGWQIVSLVSCLMSRYALVFWLPLYIFMLWIKDGWRRTAIFSGWVLLGCTVLYGPFLIKDPLIFTKAQKAYNIAINMEWTRSEKPIHLYNGMGFAIYFLEKGKDVPHQIILLRNTLLLSTVGVSLILGFIWWRIKDRINFSLFAVCSLKIALTFFYSFIFVPYSYLFVTPVMLSCVIIYMYISKLQSYRAQ
jgi:hypothetical protein